MQKIDNLGSLDWDDSALIKAYDRGMSLRIKNFEETDAVKESNESHREHRESSKKRKEWRVGDHCRAVYFGDDLMYEAKILAINGNYCVVDFLGYDEEAEVEIDSLYPSLGKKARKKQIKSAGKNFTENGADESASGDDTRNERSGSHTHSRRKHYPKNESLRFDQSANFTAAESTLHSAYPVVRYPEMSTAPMPIPGAVPPCSDVVQNPSLNAMLTAWYMAGYYTGLHQAQKCSCQHSCCCRRSHNCHQ